MDIRLNGISVTGINPSDRPKYVYEWLNGNCDYYPTIKDASSFLPFPIELPDSTLTGPETAVYISKVPPEHGDRIVIIHFGKGVDGLSLTIFRNHLADESQTVESQETSFRNKWTIYSSSQNKIFRPLCRQRFSKLTQVPRSSSIPWRFSINGCIISVIHPTNDAPLVLLWSCNGLGYLLSSGWGTNTISITDLKGLLNGWLAK